VNPATAIGMDKVSIDVSPVHQYLHFVELESSG
jgi:hypothetical protein